MSNLLLSLLELHDITFGIPAVENDMAAEVPSTRLWLQIAACSLNGTTDCRQTANHKGGFQRSFLAWRRRIC